MNTYPSYHITTSERGNVLDKYESLAKSEDELILSFLRIHYDQNFTAPEIWKALGLENKVPLSNVRRALTNLTQQTSPQVRKLEIMRKGIYKRPNHAYQYISHPHQTTLFA